VLQWGRSGLLRKTAAVATTITSLCRLQWGRSGLLRKTSQHPQAWDLPHRASMGPQRFAAENGRQRPSSPATHTLQWGRSGLLRKTRRCPPTLPADP